MNSLPTNHFIWMSNGYFNFNMVNRSFFMTTGFSLNINNSTSIHLVLILPWLFFLLCSINLVTHKSYWSFLCINFQPIPSFPLSPLWPLTWAGAIEFHLVFPTSSLSDSKPLKIATTESEFLMLCYCHYMTFNLQWFPTAVLVESKLSLPCIAMSFPILVST